MQNPRIVIVDFCTNGLTPLFCSLSTLLDSVAESDTEDQTKQKFSQWERDDRSHGRAWRLAFFEIRYIFFALWIL